MIFSDAMIDNLLREDVPYGDLTTTVMGMSLRPGVMEFRNRYPCCVAGVELAAAVLRKLALNVDLLHPSGSNLPPQTLILRAQGPAGGLHHGWRVAQNLMEYSSGIATRTHELVNTGRRIKPDLQIAGTRKSFPGGKSWCIDAVHAGGAVVHRLGLSETFLLFANHTAFFATPDAALEQLSTAGQRLAGKKLNVEVETLEQAWAAAAAGADILQFDKNSAAQLSDWIPRIRARFPAITLAAAGGIDGDNIADYARTGIDLVVTSWMYFGKPQDICVKIQPAEK